MLQAEIEHERRYGGRSRTVLLPEERDYLMGHIDAPVEREAREEMRRELAEAYVIGEMRPAERLE